MSPKTVGKNFIFNDGDLQFNVTIISDEPTSIQNVMTALMQEHCFFHLEAPIERVTGWDTPYPHALEWAYFPGPKRVGEAFRKVMGQTTNKAASKGKDT